MKRGRGAQAREGAGHGSLEEAPPPTQPRPPASLRRPRPRRRRFLRRPLTGRGPSRDPGRVRRRLTLRNPAGSGARSPADAASAPARAPSHRPTAPTRDARAPSEPPLPLGGSPHTRLTRDPQAPPRGLEPQPPRFPVRNAQQRAGPRRSRACPNPRLASPRLPPARVAIGPQRGGETSAATHWSALAAAPLQIQARDAVGGPLRLRVLGIVSTAYTPCGCEAGSEAGSAVRAAQALGTTSPKRERWVRRGGSWYFPLLTLKFNVEDAALPRTRVTPADGMQT